MATKKRATKKTPARKRKKRPGKQTSLKVYLFKSLAGLFLLLALVVTAGFLAHHLMLRKERSFPVLPGKSPVHAPQTPIKPIKPRIPQAPEASAPRTTSPSAQASVQPGPSAEKPRRIQPPFEIFPEVELPQPKPFEKPETMPPSERPMVAIIIDDVGWDSVIARKFIRLDQNLTFSIIPFSPQEKNIAGMARKGGIELMLHLPMEPMEYPKIDPGQGALLTSMSPDELIAQLEKDIAAVPGIIGVNGHMGSRMTTSSPQMYQIFSILKKKDLFFIDSYTTPDSVAKGSARLLQIPFAQRDIFIDHFIDPDFIRKQLQKLIQLAEKHGQAVGIAHPHEETLKILQEMLPELKQKVTIVPASRLVQRIG